MPDVRKRSSSPFRSSRIAERGVAGAGELAGGLEHAAEDRLGVELGHERPTDLEQPLEQLTAESARAGTLFHQPNLTAACG